MEQNSEIIANGDHVVPLLNGTHPKETRHEEGDNPMVHFIQIDETDSETPPTKPCIFRVHDGLRKPKPDAYTPMLISIGPYHSKNEKLKEMQVHKHRYLDAFLSRSGGLSAKERYKQTLRSMEKEAREFYGHPIHLDSEEFIDMLLLDGIFVVEFVTRCSEESEPHGPIFEVDWMHYQTCRDLLLFENQLPYFVISKLYEMTKNEPAVENNHSFDKVVKLTFSGMLPKLLPISIFLNGDDSGEIKHLLNVVHVLCHPLNHEGGRGSEGNNSIVRSSELREQMRCVTELQEAGVNFHKVGKIYGTADEDNITDKICLFDIKFDEGVMEIPSFKVENETESFFRNLIAYEQHTSDVYPKYFSDYASIMDQLINSSNDVRILRLEGIVMNKLGDDKVVAKLFNKLCEGVVISPSRFYYSSVCKKANEHCKKPWNDVMAKLRRDYFNSPWAGISTGAAVAILLLTVAQTIATFWNH